MPLPAVVWAAMAAVGGAVGAHGGPVLIRRIINEVIDEGELIDAALEAASERIGVTLTRDNLTPQGITDAINAGPLAGTGIELTNIFDRDALKRDIGRVAVKYASDALGVKMPQSEDDLRELLREYATDELVAQLQAGSGPWIDAINASREVVEVLQAYRAAKERREAVGVDPSE